MSVPSSACWVLTGRNCQLSAEAHGSVTLSWKGIAALGDSGEHLITIFLWYVTEPQASNLHDQTKVTGKTV